MTHSLHRRGNTDSLSRDFVFLSTPAMGFNDETTAQRLEKLIRIIFAIGPSNIGAYETGSILKGATADDMISKLQRNSRIRCAFDNKEKVKKLLDVLREEELGMSITMSGLIGDLEDICDQVGLEPHTINCSGGIHGNLKVLADEQILEISTMCGHAMVGPKIVEKMLIDVKKGYRSKREAAVEMSKPCTCGIFNPTRAVELLEEYMPLYTIHEE